MFYEVRLRESLGSHRRINSNREFVSQPISRMKTYIALIALCAGMFTLPLTVSAQTDSASPVSSATQQTTTAQHHKSDFGWIGLLGLLGLLGLRRRRSHAVDEMDDRPAAPPGSYVADLKSERRPGPE
jgi:MYXO-CTERM domain-containing protein